MCIRDRARAATAFAAAVPQCADLRAARLGGGDGPAGSWGCLLYTSDAADERSSVDLGGRRIIKKNTIRK